MKAQKESRGTALLPLTYALDRGGWSTSHPGRFTPGKDIRYPLYRRLVGPQGRSGRAWNISAPFGFGLLTVHLVASRYNNYAIPVVFQFKA